MRKTKKPIALFLALTVVMTISTCSMSASALFKLGDGKVGLGIVQGVVNSILGKEKDDSTTTTKKDTNEVKDTEEKDIEEKTTEATTKRKSLLSFYIDNDVTRHFHWGFSFGRGHDDEETTTEPTTTEPTTEEPTTEVEEITDPSTPLASAPTEVEEITDSSTPLASAPTEPKAQPKNTPVQIEKKAPEATEIIKDSSVPKAQIPSTGEASIAGVVAVTVICAAAFIISKKK